MTQADVGRVRYFQQSQFPCSTITLSHSEDKDSLCHVEIHNGYGVLVYCGEYLGALSVERT
jgi:hypothetical protein